MQRFGDNCYFLLFSQEDILTNADSCNKRPGEALFWPENKEELTFIRHAFPEEMDKVHLGVRAVSDTHGVLNADYSVGVGMPFVTHGATGDSILAGMTQPDDLMSLQECLIYDKATDSVIVENPCDQKRYAACKKRMSQYSIHFCFHFTIICLFFSSWQC